MLVVCFARRSSWTRCLSWLSCPLLVAALAGGRAFRPCFPIFPTAIDLCALVSRALANVGQGAVVARLATILGLMLNRSVSLLHAAVARYAACLPRFPVIEFTINRRVITARLRIARFRFHEVFFALEAFSIPRHVFRIMNHFPLLLALTAAARCSALNPSFPV